MQSHFSADELYRSCFHVGERGLHAAPAIQIQLPLCVYFCGPHLLVCLYKSYYTFPSILTRQTCKMCLQMDATDPLQICSLLNKKRKKNDCHCCFSSRCRSNHGDKSWDERHRNSVFKDPVGTQWLWVHLGLDGAFCTEGHVVDQDANESSHHLSRHPRAVPCTLVWLKKTKKNNVTDDDNDCAVLFHLTAAWAAPTGPD